MTHHSRDDEVQVFLQGIQLRRLTALGYVQTGFAGMRPWTRLECARLVQEAEQLIEQQDLEKGEAVRLYRALAQEFAPEVARLDGERNRGAEVGSWIGREGKGVQAWSTYWLSPRSTIQISYRNAHVAKDFLEGGGYQDFGARADLLVRPQLSLASSLQYEQWDFPLLSPARNSNITASLQLTYWPKWRIR